MRQLLLIAMILAASAAPPRAAATAVPTRAEVMDLIRAGNDPAALEACRSYLASHPGDGAMVFNLACLEARSGRTDAALGTLEGLARSGAAGLRVGVEPLLADPDLAPLRADPRFAALVTEIRSQLVLDAAAGGARLAARRPEVVTLRPHRPSPVSAHPRLELVWQPEALLLRAAPGTTWPVPVPDRPQVLLTLGLRDPQEPYLARAAFQFAFGATAAGGAWGAVWVPSLGRWQQVVELAPRSSAGSPWTVAVPWSLIQPLHPLIDGDLGLNIALLAGDGGPDDALSLVDDPELLAPAAPTHRVARLDFDAASWQDAAFLGRLRDSIVRGGVLEFELAAVSPTAGQGVLSIDFLDNQARSVLPQGAATGVLPLTAGLQRIDRQASFAGVRTGSYQLRAELTLPDGGRQVWGATVLNLAPGWEDSLAARAAGIAPVDRPTVDHLLAAVDAALAEHRPRWNPGPIATTLGDLDAMLDRAEKTGSVWPSDGPGLVVYPGPDGGDRLASVYRPRPGAGRGPETPVLVITDAAGTETTVAGLLDRFYANGDLRGAGQRHPVYVVPHLPAAGGPAEAAAALAFVRQRFGSGSVLVAGIAAGSGRLEPMLEPWQSGRTLPLRILDGTGGLAPAADRVVVWAEELPAQGTGRE